MRVLDKVYSGFCVDDSSIRELWNIVADGVCDNTSVIRTKYTNGKVYIFSWKESCMHLHLIQKLTFIWRIPGVV